MSIIEGGNTMTESRFSVAHVRMTSDRTFADVQAAFERQLGRFEPDVRAGQSGFWQQKRARSSMVRERPTGRGALGSGIGSQMRQSLLHRPPAQCSMVPGHNRISPAEFLRPNRCQSVGRVSVPALHVPGERASPRTSWPCTVKPWIPGSAREDGPEPSRKELS